MNSPHLEGKAHRNRGGALGQFSHNNSGAGSPDGIDDPNGDCFSLIIFFFSFFGTDSFFQGGPYFVPGNRPCTGEVPVPDKGRTVGGPCAPPPLAKRPPHPSKTFFRCWGKAAAARSWRGWARAGPSPARPAALSGGHRAGVFLRGRDLCTLRPAFRCQAPADAHLSAFELPKIRFCGRSSPSVLPADCPSGGRSRFRRRSRSLGRNWSIASRTREATLRFSAAHSACSCRICSDVAGRDRRLSNIRVR